MTTQVEKLCGWIPVEQWTPGIRRTVRDYIASLAHPDFELSEPYAAIRGAGEGVDVFHWTAELKLFGKLLPAYHQTIGSCVSQGWGRAAQDQLLIDIAQRLEPEGLPIELKKDLIVATEPIYGGSRNEIGGGRLGNSDGSVGSWAARWVTEWGILFRQKYGAYDLSKPDESLAQKWGNRGVGVPDALEPLSREHPISSVAVCRSWEGARDALATFNSVVICSSQGFTTTRVGGFCKPSGTWNHCMLLRGCGVAKGNRPFGVVQNSWGQTSPGGPGNVTLETGDIVELPKGCFCVDADVLDQRILRSGDCHVASGIRGFRRSRPNYNNLA